MHGCFKLDPPRGQRRNQRRGRHFRNGQCAAARRADTAARLLLGLPIYVNSLDEVAQMCGTNAKYVAAAITVIESEDKSLQQQVRQGIVPLLKGAATVKNRAALIKAYRQAHPADLAALARTVGPEAVFDSVISPSL
jgi:hypothetical protein